MKWIRDDVLDGHDSFSGSYSNGGSDNEEDALSVWKMHDEMQTNTLALRETI